MMEHHLQQQQQQKSPTSPHQGNSKEEQALRPRQFNCVYLSDGKPATFNFGINPEATALCTSSNSLPTPRSSVSSSGAASSSSPTVLTPSVNAASNTPPPVPAPTTRTSFMISDILDSPSSRSRTCSTASGSAPNEGSGVGSYGSFCDDASTGRESPRSVVSDDVDGKERENMEDSMGASDSDVERSGQAGK